MCAGNLDSSFPGMANPHVEVVDSKPVIAALRKIKDEGEVARIRKASEIADIGIRTAMEAIKEV